MRSLPLGLLLCVGACTPAMPDQTDTADATADSADSADSAPADSAQESSPTDTATDADGDGWTDRGGDCDDTRSDVHPGATEQCDARDWDCDGQALTPGLCAEPVPVDVVSTRLTSDGNSAAVWPIGDVSGDGRPDLVAHEHDAGPPDPDGVRGPAWLVGANVDGTLLGYPDTMYAAFSQRADEVEAETRGPFGDVDGDGISDLGIPMSSPNAIYLHLGPMTPGVRWADETDTWWSSSARDTASPWGFPIVSGGDLDGDGRTDAVVGVSSVTGPFAADVFLGGRYGDDSAVARIYSDEWAGGDGALLDDLDGDGLFEVYLGMEVHHVLSGADLATADGATLDDLSFLRLPNGEGAQWSGYSGDAITPGDWTGDGVADLLLGQPFADVAGTDAGVILCFDGRARGTVDPEDAVGSWVNPLPDARTTAIARLDFDGDGGDDVVASSAGAWFILPAAHGLPGPYQPIGGLHYAGDDSALVSHPGADFDGDGDDELLYNEYRDALRIGYLDGWAVPWDEPTWW